MLIFRLCLEAYFLSVTGKLWGKCFFIGCQSPINMIQLFKNNFEKLIRFSFKLIYTFLKSSTHGKKTSKFSKYPHNRNIYLNSLLTI